MYTINYKHAGAAAAESMADAMLTVRIEAIRVRESAKAAAEVVKVRCEDGTYCYLDQESADADDTGAAAFAVIERNDEE